MRHIFNDETLLLVLLLDTNIQFILYETNIYANNY